jgi:hypothetical protein
LRDRILEPVNKVVALGADAMHSSSDVETISAALRLKRANLHPKPPTVGRGSRGQARVVLYPRRRAAVSRAAAIDINAISHPCSWLGAKAQMARARP